MKVYFALFSKLAVKMKSNPKYRNQIRKPFALSLSKGEGR